MIRAANYRDAEPIQNLLRIFSETGKVLFRSLNEIRGNITDFQVYEKNNQIMAICSLKTDQDQLAELRSLVVDPRYSGLGIGSKMIESSIEKAIFTSTSTLFVLTYSVSMFKRLGFEIVNKETLPHKVWNDCKACLHQTTCDETAMILPLVSLRTTRSIQTPYLETLNTR